MYYPLCDSDDTLIEMVRKQEYLPLLQFGVSENSWLVEVRTKAYQARKYIFAVASNLGVMSVREPHDYGQVARLIEHCRNQGPVAWSSRELSWNSAPLPFDSILAVGSEWYRPQYAGLSAAVNRRIFLIVPVYECEIARAESPEDFVDLISRSDLRISDWSRSPSPRVKIQYSVGVGPRGYWVQLTG